MMTTIALVLIGFFGLLILFSGIFTVRQQSSAAIERFGKFRRVSNSGLHFKIPVIRYSNSMCWLKPKPRMMCLSN